MLPADRRSAPDCQGIVNTALRHKGSPSNSPLDFTDYTPEDCPHSRVLGHPVFHRHDHFAIKEAALDRDS